MYTKLCDGKQQFFLLLIQCSALIMPYYQVIKFRLDKNKRKYNFTTIRQKKNIFPLYLNKISTYGSLSLSLRFGSPMYSESSCINILINILLADDVSSSLR